MKKPNRIARKGDTAAKAAQEQDGAIVAQRKQTPRKAAEWKIVALRETNPTEMPKGDSPELAVEYWRKRIATAPNFNPEAESMVVLVLNTKFRIRGHHIIATGTINECLAHPRECFRAAVMAAAYAVVFMHNHPSGEPSPSIADMGLTQRLLEAGNVLQIRVLDHIIVGYDSHHSMEACGQMLAKPLERGERRSRLDWRKITALETQIYSTEALMDLFASTLTDHLEVAENRENNRVAAGVAELSRERRVKLRAAFDDLCRAVRMFREAA